MRPKNILAGFLAGFALAAGAWIALGIKPEPAAPQHATVLPEPNPVPAFDLLDQAGNPVTESVFAGQWDLVFFGFTHCPDICPLTLQVLSSAQRKLAEAGSEPLPRIVLVSVDPDRDTPEKMAAYMASFGEAHLGLTGELEEIRKLTSGLGIFFEKRDSDNEYYVVDHSAVVLLIDPAGRFHALFSSPHDIGNYVHDLPLLTAS